MRRLTTPAPLPPFPTHVSPPPTCSTPGAEAADDAEADDGEVAGGTLPPGMLEMLRGHPGALQALSAMAGLEGLSSGLIESLPPQVKRRVKALKRLQMKCIDVDVEYHKEMAELEAKYHIMKESLFKEVGPPPPSPFSPPRSRPVRTPLPAG